MRLNALSTIFAGRNCQIHFTLNPDEAPKADKRGIYLPKTWKNLKINKAFEDEVFVNVFHEFQHIRHSSDLFFDGAHKKWFQKSHIQSPYPDQFFQDCCNAALDCRDDALGFKAYKGAASVYARDAQKYVDTLKAFKESGKTPTPEVEAAIVLAYAIFAYQVTTRREFKKHEQIFDLFPELADLARAPEVQDAIDAFVKMNKKTIKARLNEGGHPLGEVGMTLADHVWKGLKRKFETQSPPPSGGESECPEGEKGEETKKDEPPTETPEDQKKPGTGGENDSETEEKQEREGGAGNGDAKEEKSEEGAESDEDKEDEEPEETEEGDPEENEKKDGDSDEDKAEDKEEDAEEEPREEEEAGEDETENETEKDGHDFSYEEHETEEDGDDFEDEDYEDEEWDEVEGGDGEPEGDPEEWGDEEEPEEGEEEGGDEGQAQLGGLPEHNEKPESSDKEFNLDDYKSLEEAGYSKGLNRLAQIADEAFEEGKIEGLADVLRRIFETDRKPEEKHRVNVQNLWAVESDPDYVFEDYAEARAQEDWTVGLIIDNSSSMRRVQGGRRCAWDEHGLVGREGRFHPTIMKRVKQAALEIQAAIEAVNDMAGRGHELIVTKFDGHGIAIGQKRKEVVFNFETLLYEEVEVDNSDAVLRDHYVIKGAGDRGREWVNLLQADGGTTPYTGIEALKIALRDNPNLRNRLLVIMLTDGDIWAEDWDKIQKSREELPEDHLFCFVEMLTPKAQWGNAHVADIAEFPSVIEGAVAEALTEN